jgi:cation:H+ antiporter
LGSAIQGKADLSVGNVVGSNIANIGLVLGLSAMIRPMKIDREVFRRDLPAMLMATLLIVVLPFIGGPTDTGDGVVFMIDRWKAVILLAFLGGFLLLMLRGSRSAGSVTKVEGSRRKRTLLIVLTIVGLCALLVGGKMFVDGAVLAAMKLGIPELVIGLTVVAVGTSLPELATSIVAIIKGESAISLGNVVGSNIFNICMVLGLVSLISPLAIDSRVMQMDMIAMVAFSVGVTALAWRGRQLYRLEGAILLIAYCLYVANLFTGWV